MTHAPVALALSCAFLCVALRKHILIASHPVSANAAYSASC